MKKNLKKIKDSIKKIPRMAAEKSFIFSVILILLALLIGSLEFYKYYILAGHKESEAAQSSLKIKQENYLFVISQWQERQEKFDSADFKNWLDPFFISGLTK